MCPGARAFLGVAAVALLAVTFEPRAAADSPATGPDAASRFCIAGVCLGGLENDILQRFGDGRPYPAAAPSVRCYQARGKSYYVTVSLDDQNQARRVTGILLSSETSCPAAAPARFAPDRAACRELKPFDSADRLRSLGATEQPPRDQGDPWKASPRDVTRFDYRCEPDKECSIVGSAFVRDGTIIAVGIRKPDC